MALLFWLCLPFLEAVEIKVWEDRDDMYILNR